MMLEVRIVALAPIWALLAAVAVVLLMLVAAELMRRSVPRAAIRSVAALGVAGAAAGAIPGLFPSAPGGGDRGALCAPDHGCLYAVGPEQAVLQLLALGVLAVVAVALGAAASPPAVRHRTPSSTGVNRTLHEGARTILQLFAAVGAVTAPAARDVLSLVLALNLTLISVTVILVEPAAGHRHGDRRARLLPLAAVSTALTLVGAALWIAATGTPFLGSPMVSTSAQGSPVAGATEAVLNGSVPSGALLVTAAVLIIAGALAGFVLAPIHGWTPRAGAAVQTAISSPKGGHILVLLPVLATAGVALVLTDALARFGAPPLTPVAVIALVILLGAGVMALRQRDLHRLVGYSTALQAGWVLLPLAAVGASSGASAVSHLSLVIVATVLVTIVVIGTATATGSADLGEHHDLIRRQPALGVALGVGLLTLAGLPPAVAGVLAKMLVLQPVVDAGLWWILAAAALGYALTAAVYLRWLMVTITSRPGPGAPTPIGLSWPQWLVVILAAAALVLGSVFPVWVW